MLRFFMNKLSKVEQINPELLKKAKNMYMTGIFPVEIADSLEIPLNLIRLCCFGKDDLGTDPDCWNSIRNNSEVTSTNAYTKVRSLVIDTIESSVVATAMRMSRQLEKDMKKRIAEGDAPVTTKELSDIISVIERINKIGRLERGEATEINEINMNSWSSRDVMEYERENNPLFSKKEIIEAEYKESEDE